MARRKTSRKTNRSTDRTTPRPEVTSDSRHRAFLEEFLAGGEMGVEFPCGTANRYEHVAALRNVATVLALPVSVTARGTRVLVMRTTPAPASQFPDPKVALEEHITFVQGTPIEDGDLLPSVAEADHKGGQTDGQN